MEKVSLMQKEIENKRKLPKEVKKNIDNAVFYNLLTAISIIVYMCIINAIFLNVSESVFDICVKTFAIVLISATVIIFEIAYRKDSAKICITGIEFLVYSVIVLYIRYIYLHTTQIYRGIIMTIPIFIAVYYIGKTIIIYIKIRRDYKNDLSDIKELLAEKTESYLDENSTKILKEQKILKDKKENKKKQVNKTKNKTNNKK